MTELDIDLQPNGEGFDAAFRLPNDFPEDLRALHTEMITRMRNESRAVSAGTNVLVLIERMTWFYVSMKRQELYPETGEELSLADLQKLNDFWLKMHAEYNKLITSAESRSRVAMLMAVQEILADSLEHLEDQPEKQRALQEMWAARFHELGV